MGLAVSASLYAADGEAAKDGDITPLRTGTPHEAFFSIEFSDDTGLAVGAGGAIYRSGDKGKTWEREAAGKTQLALLDVSIGESQSIAVGQFGVILRSTSEGEWDEARSGTEMRLMSIDQNENMAVAVGQFGAILRSTDGGQNWESVAPEWVEYSEEGHEPQLYSVTINKNNVITAVGEFGMVVGSDDGGETWRKLNGGAAADPSLFSITMGEDGVGYVVGQSGSMLKSTDCGSTWQALDSGTDAILLSVYQGESGDLFVTGIREMMRSTDNGQTWKKIRGGDIHITWYQDIAAAGENEALLAVGHTGKIIKVDR